MLPEQNTWFIEEISKRLLIELKLTKEVEIVDRLKKILKTLEENQAVIFVKGFEAFNLVEPKLLYLVNPSKLGK